VFKDLKYPLLVGLFSSLMTGAMMGCEPAPAVAPRTNLSFQTLKSFPKQDIDFYAAQLFLWPEGVTAKEISRVLALSDDMERLEQEISPASLRFSDLKERLAASEPEFVKQEQLLNGQKKDLNKSISNKRNALRKRSEELEAAKKSEEEEKKKENPDPELLKKLADTRIRLEGEVAVIEKEIPVLEEQRSALEKEILDVRNSPDHVELKDLESKIAVNFDLKNTDFQEVTKTVIWHDPAPKPVKLHFEKDGSISALIQGWNITRDDVERIKKEEEAEQKKDLPDLDRLKKLADRRQKLEDEGNRDFSTKSKPGKKPTILNVKYTELGGIFDFDVNVYEDDAQTQLRETYAFHIARTKYDSKDGKIYYTGTMIRTRVKPDGTTELRRGVAKLIDKNN